MATRRRKLTTALVTTLVTLGALELVLRRWYPIGGRSYREDAELIHVPAPGARRLQLMPAHADAQRVLVTIGPDGYRGPALEDPRSRPRIAVLGDSFVLAGNSPYPDTFAVQLGEALGGGFEVVNCGAESYGPDQSILRLEREFRHLDPDLILLVLCAHNDLGDLVRNKLFRLDERGALVRSAPLLGPNLRARFAARERRARRPAILRWLEHLTREREDAGVVEGAGWIDLYLEAARFQYEDYQRGDPMVDDVEHDTYDADVALGWDTESSRAKRRLLAALMERLAAFSTSHDVPVGVLVVPSPIDVDPSFPIRPDPVRHAAHDPLALARACREAAEAAGLSTLDLTEVFTANDPATMYVGADDIHWNAKAQRLCAERAAGWLTQHGLLP